MMKILFVCTGNTCRSAMAEAIFKDIADLRDFKVSSAGFSTFTGDMPTAKAVIVCDRHGINLTRHRTTALGEANVDEMDLVLTATAAHRNRIGQMYPNAQVYTIREYAGGYDDCDISDPITGDLETYEQCFSDIEEALKKVLAKLSNH